MRLSPRTTLLLGLPLLFTATLALAAPPQTKLISVNTGGSATGNDGSAAYDISQDGRYVAFASSATNLVTGDTNSKQDVFVRDRHTGTTSRVSVKTDGTEGSAESSQPAISAAGRYVAFYSSADNLVEGDTNGIPDIFVHDCQTGTTARVSVKTDGNEGNNSSYQPSISADGRYVAFYSYAGNLVDGDTNGKIDVFVHDRQTGTTARVSVKTGGAEGNADSYTPSISADGRYVAFYSYAVNLVEGDSNGKADVFIHDRQTGTTSRVSVKTDGSEGNAVSYQPSISADGRYVAFSSLAGNLVDDDTNGKTDIFVHDRQTGTTARVSVKTGGAEGNNESFDPDIDDTGRHVIFASKATNLVDGDSNGFEDVFMHDRETGITSLISVDNQGNQGNGNSDWSAISGNGKYVTFDSPATNFTANDTNGTWDVFIRGPLTSFPWAMFLPATTGSRP
jgi:Tol biopolymer transport system component